MFSYDFVIPFPEMTIYMVMCIFCLMVGGMIIKRYLPNKVDASLIPLILVVFSVIVNNIHYGGWEQFMQINIYDLRGVINGLAAVGLYELIKQTLFLIKSKWFKSKHSKSKKIS